ncbi:MAG: rRNA maturation RNase YbeY [Actinomycetota bacterium]
MDEANRKSGDVTIANEQDSVAVDNEKAILLAEYVLSEEKASGQGELAITFVVKDEMASLNSRYRRLEGPTDVLSFSLRKSGEDEFVSPVPLMGNVIICPEVAAANAAKDGRSLQSEIDQLVVHGILHILDYGHSTAEDEAKMFERQAELVDRFKNAGQL